jgi:hypothetical protein
MQKKEEKLSGARDIWEGSRAQLSALSGLEKKAVYRLPVLHLIHLFETLYYEICCMTLHLNSSTATKKRKERG